MNDFDIFDDEDEDHEPLWCQYPDGSLVDVATEEGANGFLDQAFMPGYFSRLVSEIRKLRKKQSNNKRLGNSEKSELMDTTNSSTRLQALQIMRTLAKRYREIKSKIG